MKETKKRETEKLIKEAKALASIGLTTREIGGRIGKSHAWVALKLKKKN